MSTVVASRGRIPDECFDREILKRTVKLHGKSFGLSDILNFLRLNGVLPAEVEAMQRDKPGEDSHTITFSNAEVIKKLVNLKYKDKKIHLVQLGKQVVRVRIHWLSHYYTDAAVKLIMSDYGKVLAVNNLATNIDGFTIKSGVREVSLEVDEMQRLQIQHLINSVDRNACLLTILGKPPLCLRCSAVVHVRSNCPGSLYTGVVRRRNDIGAV
ncbi:hypothetical protein ACF0H5_002013 [Mactra antiquata]